MARAKMQPPSAGRPLDGTGYKIPPEAAVCLLLPQNTFLCFNAIYESLAFRQRRAIKKKLCRSKIATGRGGMIYGLNLLSPWCEFCMSVRGPYLTGCHVPDSAELMSCRVSGPLGRDLSPFLGVHAVLHLFQNHLRSIISTAANPVESFKLFELGM